MTARTDAASAMTESVDFWYGSQLLGCPELPALLASRIGTGMWAMGYERNEAGRWVKVPMPRQPVTFPQPSPAPVVMPDPRRALDRTAVA